MRPRRTRSSTRRGAREARGAPGWSVGGGGGEDPGAGAGGPRPPSADPVYPRAEPGNPGAGAPRRAERLALFGGSFDPVHRGHLFAAEAARKAFELDRVLLVPAARSPHKGQAPHASGEERARLLEIAIADRPWLSVSRLELERGGPSYTLDTVRGLRREHPGAELFLVIGADHLAQLPEWRGAEELLALVRPIVVHRGGDPRARIRALEGRLVPARIRALEQGLVLLPPVEVSATDLRARLARGEDPGPDLPPGVLAEIQARGLYGWPR